MPDELNARDMQELSLDEGLTLLEDTLQMLEEGGLSLEESFKLYKKGMELIKICDAKVDRVEKQIIILEKEDGDESDDL